ncbi:dsDNA nuclease domain-containing protein [Pseudomonas fluorescens]|uniref:dsDNA nuclease domain-containing protein n=1 Tax=Pseudomonas fluorescens TaxID=294 RepID=UPI002ACA38D2|nr:dsDNA nuclease domain-containing protein [Pseudomonas fluorescens]MDZ5436776.1 dsDNA nuclease domain-containing protein [Pseudomonas fluorescens]
MNLTDKATREHGGRIAIERFRAQFKAAGLESLRLLEDGDMERVYCDFHEDYVVKHVVNYNPRYRFVQVKTNGKLNYQYNILEIFGLKKRPKKALIHDLKSSYAGKLLLHVESFGVSCQSIEIYTNVNFDDEVEQIIDEIRGAGKLTANTISLIAETRKLIASLTSKSDEEVIAFLSHLRLSPRKQILNDEEEGFVAQASHQIYKYSEINLTPDEVRQIIVQLLSLIEDRSAVPLASTISEEELNKKSSVVIDDVLDILTISRSAYYILKNGGDDKAIKSASILQRVLKKNGFSGETVDIFASFKVQWETWFRTNRHDIPEFRLTIIKQGITQLAKKLATGQVDMNTITPEIATLSADMNESLTRSDISEELTFGAVLSELVKGEAV